MNSLSEMQIYIRVKRYLVNESWKIIGGQPPSGTDHLPVIEIKDPENLAKGSKGSLKPDLVTVKSNEILIIELKPNWNLADQEKLISFLENSLRIKLFYEELLVRKIRDEKSVLIGQFPERYQVRGVLGYGGDLLESQLLSTIHVGNQGISFHSPCLD